MDLRAVIGIGAGLLQIASNIPYIRDMLRGTTRPSVVSYIIWFTLSVIAVAAQWSAGASWSILILLAVVINTFIILVLALRGYGYRKYTSLDWICFALGIVAIVLWKVTSNPMTALITTLGAIILAVIPTIRKTYREPQTEHAISWLIAAGAAVLGIIATRWDMANLVFPVYYLIEGLTISGLAFFRKQKK